MGKDGAQHRAFAWGRVYSSDIGTIKTRPAIQSGKVAKGHPAQPEGRLKTRQAIKR